MCVGSTMIPAMPTGLPHVTPTMAINGGEYRLALHGSNHGDERDGSAIAQDHVFVIKVSKSTYEHYYIVQVLSEGSCVY